MTAAPGALKPPEHPPSAMDWLYTLLMHTVMQSCAAEGMLDSGSIPAYEWAIEELGAAGLVQTGHESDRIIARILPAGAALLQRLTEMQALQRQSHGTGQTAREIFQDLTRIQHHKNTLYLEHPEPSPEQAHPVDYLIHPPGRLASTDAFIRFRDETLLPMMAARPEDRNLPRYAAAVAEILAWRQTVPPQYRFWRSGA